MGCFIKYSYNEVFCEIYEDGSILVKCDLMTLSSLETLETMFKEVINKKIISVLNNHTEKFGYKYNNFTQLSGDNIEMNSINISYLVPFSKNVNLSKYSSCLNQVFTVYSDVLNDENNRIEMTYKRVSYYRKMNDMDTFITVLYKNKIS